MAESGTGDDCRRYDPYSADPLVTFAELLAGSNKVQSLKDITTKISSGSRQ
jgi:hypothetical protein